ncbi:MAG: alpha/beta hydrolase [Methanolinea sp.]|nr:alpha/beta hydrolase [Methanolinea sp.]
MRVFAPLICLSLLAVLLAAGCSERSALPPAGYSVDDSGMLTLECPPCTANETPQERYGDVTVSRIVFLCSGGDVYALAAYPPSPRAGFVLSPGAGVKKEGYISQALLYAEKGYAFLVLDVRGNGGETAGYPLDLERDFSKFSTGAWPQYYLSVCDMVTARKYLDEKFQRVPPLPVYAMGESNGGRYAAVAAGVDPAFAGYIGISTSGFSRAGAKYTGDPRRFLLSVDPEIQAQRLSPRPSWIFHAAGDPIIPFSRGQEFFLALPEPKEFFSFNGTHGSNAEVHELILGKCAQIYGPAG